MINVTENDAELIIKVRELLNNGFDIPRTAKELNLSVRHVDKLILSNIPTDKIYFDTEKRYWNNENEMNNPVYTFDSLSQNEIEFYNSYKR